jgi:hypothetical protein
MLSFQFLYTALWLNFKLKHVADFPDFLNVIVFDRQILILLLQLSLLVFVRWCSFYVSDYRLLSDTVSTVEEFSIHSFIYYAFC